MPWLFTVAVAAWDFAAVLDFLPSGAPFPSDGAGGNSPKGDAHECASFFYATWMSRRKIPSVEWTRSA